MAIIMHASHITHQRQSQSISLFFVSSNIEYDLFLQNKWNIKPTPIATAKRNNTTPNETSNTLVVESRQSECCWEDAIVAAVGRKEGSVEGAADTVGSEEGTREGTLEGGLEGSEDGSEEGRVDG